MTSKEYQKTPEEMDDEEEIIHLKNVKHLSASEIKSLREASPEAIAKADQVILNSVHLFFGNRVKDAEDNISKYSNRDPLAMCAAGLFAFIRAALSMEQEQTDHALRIINESISFASQLHPTEGIFATSRLSRLGHALTGRSPPKTNWLTEGEYRSKTVHAHSEALRCFVLILQQSVTSLMKAGLSLSRGYKSYMSLSKERDERTAAGDDANLNPNAIYSVDFGLGAFNVVLSILPDNVKAMLRFLGFNGDREVGLAMMRRCFHSKTLLSSFASAFLMGIEGVLGVNCPLLCPLYLPEAQAVALESMQRPELQNSVLHLWLVGRVDRLARNLDKSIERMQQCMLSAREAQLHDSMPQLGHFVLYDQGLNFMMSRQWLEAVRCYETLEAEANKWSQMFYVYARACCYEMLAADSGVSPEEQAEYARAATELYWRTAHQKHTLLGGNVVNVDQFASKRLDEILAVAGVDHPNPGNKVAVEPLKPLPTGITLRNPMPLPAYELLVLFSLSHQLSEDAMHSMNQEIDAALRVASTYNLSSKASVALAEAAKLPIGKESDAKPMPGGIPEEFVINVLLGVKASFLANSFSADDRKAAVPLLDALLAAPRYKDKSYSISWVLPNSLYEMALVKYYTESREACESLLSNYKKNFGSAHYYFHSKIELKEHLVYHFFSMEDEKKKQNARKQLVKNT